MQDEQILELYFARDEQAIRESESKYGGYCRTVAGNTLASREDVEEAVSDSWLRAWNAIPPQRPAVLRLFFAKIVRNCAFNIHRTKAAQKRGTGELAQRVEEGHEEIWEDLKRVINSSPKPFTKQFRPVSGHIELLDSGMPKLRLDPTDTTGAPKKVEMMIFPFVAEGKDFEFHSDCIPTFVEAPEGVTKGVARYYSVNWEYEQGGRVEYWQISRGCSLHYTNHSYAPADSVRVEAVTIGGYELLQVTCEENLRQQTMGKEFYWMDDDYRYILICPQAMTDAEVLEILDSLDRI